MSNFFSPLAMALRPLFEQMREDDALFDMRVEETTERVDKPKSFEECCEYIMGEAYDYASSHKDGNFGLAGCSSEVLEGMMRHYFDEDDIEVKKIGAGTKVASSKVTAKTPAKSTPKTPVKAQGEGEAVKTPKVASKPTETASTDKQDKPKKLSDAQLRRGENCGDLFAEFFS